MPRPISSSSAASWRVPSSSSRGCGFDLPLRPRQDQAHGGSRWPMHRHSHPQTRPMLLQPLHLRTRGLPPHPPQRGEAVIWDEPESWGEYREPCRLNPCPVHTSPTLITPPETSGLKWAKTRRPNGRSGSNPFHAWRNGEGVCHIARGHERTKAERDRQPVNACGQCLRLLTAKTKETNGGGKRSGPLGVNAPLIILGVKP